MKNALRKDGLRQIRVTIHRFLSILIITALGIAFFSGLRASGPDMRSTATSYYDSFHFMDIRLLSTAGFNREDLDAINDAEGIDKVMPAHSYDTLLELPEQIMTIRLHSLTDNHLTGNDINSPELRAGRMPQNSGEALADWLFIEASDKKLGDYVTFSSGTAQPLSDILATDTYQIVGIANNPLYISIERGLGNVGGGRIDSFFYIPAANFLSERYTEVYLTIDNEAAISRFSEEYGELLETVRLDLTERGRGWYVLDHDANVGFSGFKQDAQRIDALSLVMPVLFFMVAILVTMTSMTRLVDSDRPQIATLKALGYSNGRVALRYLNYAVAASFIGSIIGLIAGYCIFPQTIFNAYSSLYTIPRTPVPFNMSEALLAILVAVACAALPAYIVCMRASREVPAVLMRPEAPRIGKRTWIERAAPLWSRLNFSQKVTVRNLFRYKKRLIMTVLGVSGCTALMFAGFGLRDSITTIADKQYGVIINYDMQIDFRQDATAADKESLEAILATHNNIAATTRLLQESIDVMHDGRLISALLHVPEIPSEAADFIHFQNRRTAETLVLQDDSVILTEKLATLLGLETGDVVAIRNSGGQEVSVQIGGIMENYMYHYVYMPPFLYHTLFGQEPVANQVLSYVHDNTRESSEQLATAVLQQPAVTSVSLNRDIKASVEDIIGALRYVVLVLIVSAALLVFVVLFSLTTINLEERSRELATLKVLGFNDRELAAYIYSENAVLTVVGTAAGLLLGVVLQRYIVITVETDTFMFSRDLLWQSYVYSAGLTILFASVVNLIMFRHIARIDMVSSLKSVE